MSYDLFFYKRKGSASSEEEIANYLTTNLIPVNEHGNQWFFENEKTEVYFSFETVAPGDDPDHDELFESFPEFDNTRFMFNLNFMRPAFFGLEAFQFVDKFVKDLGLYVLNPQEDSDTPYIPTKEALFENWNSVNLTASKENFGEESNYYPLEESNKIWEYNFKVATFQDELGDDYFVPRIFFYKTIKDNKIVTLSIWTEHIPIILPKTEYYLLTREYKKLLKTIKDTVLLSRQALLEKFGKYFDDYPFGECKIIHPGKAEEAGDAFNSIKSELKFEKHMERVAMETLYNAKP